jgi:F0F1-type ATP synthase assembly protein I
MEIIYDHTFNSNEWFVILIILGGAILMLLLKRYFIALESVACYLYGMYWGMFFDHTLSVVPWGFLRCQRSLGLSIYGFLDLCFLWAI